MPAAKEWNDYPAPIRDPASGCLRWQGPHHSAGYGILKGRQYAHRAAWEREVGPIPDAHQVDHVAERGCVYRDCVEIGHLEPITQAENIRRQPNVQAQMARTECPKGHKYPENVRVRRGKRECRRCHNDRVSARRKARRQAAVAALNGGTSEVPPAPLCGPCSVESGRWLDTSPMTLLPRLSLAVKPGGP